jgi:Protein of unknown function (DUF4013)
MKLFLKDLSFTMAIEQVQKALLPTQSFKFFFQDSDWTLKTGIGGLFNALSLVVLTMNPAFLPISFCLWALVTGYMLAVINAEMKDKATIGETSTQMGSNGEILIRRAPAVYKLPEWKNWIELFVSGLTWIAVATILFLFTLAVFPLGIILASLCNAFQGGQASLFGSVVWLVGSWTLSMVIAAIMSFFASYLMVNFAAEQNIAYALSFSRIIERFRYRPLQLSQAWLINIGLQFLAVLLPLVTVVGIFLIPSTLFVAQVVGSHLLARAWRSAALP